MKNLKLVSSVFGDVKLMSGTKTICTFNMKNRNVQEDATLLVNARKMKDALELYAKADYGDSSSIDGEIAKHVIKDLGVVV